MITRLILLAALLVNFLTAPSQVNTIDASLKKDLYSSVLVHMKVKVTNDQGESRRGLGGCSGTYISQTEILTAGHCVENNSHIAILAIWVRGVDGRSFSATLKKVDYEKDLALLEIKNATHKHGIATIYYTPLKLGQDIRAIGSPLGLEFLVSKGVVSKIDFKIKEFKSKYIIHDAMINPGSSGGGLFNMDGELVGVNTMTMGLFGWMGISLSVSADDIKEFLSK